MTTYTTVTVPFGAGDDLVAPRSIASGTATEFFYGTSSTSVGGTPVTYTDLIDGNSTPGDTASDDTTTYASAHQATFNTAMHARFDPIIPGVGNFTMGHKARQSAPYAVPAGADLLDPTLILVVRAGWACTLTPWLTTYEPDATAGQSDETIFLQQSVIPNPPSTFTRYELPFDPFYWASALPNLPTHLAQRTITLRVGVGEAVGVTPTGNTDVAYMALQFTLATLTTVQPPLRQYPRTDGLGASTTRRVWPPSRSVQGSNRQVGGYQ